MSERPGTGEVIAGVAGFILLIGMFIFAWFGVEGFTGDAFDTLDDWVNIVLVFTAFSGIALALFGPDIPRADVAPLGAVAIALGALSTLIVLIHIIAPPGIEAGPLSVDLDPEFGVFLGLISAAGVAVGGYMAVQEEGGGAGLAFGGGGGAAAPAAPQAPDAPQQPESSAPPPPAAGQAPPPAAPPPPGQQPPPAAGGPPPPPPPPPAS